MAHNLNETNGKISFASTKKAWHGLGAIVDQAMTTKEAIELAGLGFEVIKTPLITKIDGQEILVPEKYATVRTDTKQPLGVVGERYTILQNSEAFIFFDSIIGSDMAVFETAGVIGDGQRVFITAKMPDFIRINGTNDITEMYVVLTSSHDGTGSIVAMVTAQRIVCQNTLNGALRSAKNKISIRHTTNAKVNLENAHKLLGITHAYTEELNQCFNHLAKKKVTDKQVKQMIDAVYIGENEDGTRLKNIRENVFRSYQEGKGQEGIQGSAWAAYNGVTFFESNIRSYKSQDIKFTNVMQGTGAKIASEALNYLLAL